MAIKSKRTASVPVLEQKFLSVAGRSPTTYEQDQLLTLGRTRGESSTERALEIIFSSDFAWVKDDKLSFLAHDPTWTRHIESRLHVQPPTLRKGEQSEFGERPEGIGYTREW